MGVCGKEESGGGQAREEAVTEYIVALSMIWVWPQCRPLCEAVRIVHPHETGPARLQATHRGAPPL